MSPAGIYLTGLKMLPNLKHVTIPLRHHGDRRERNLEYQGLTPTCDSQCSEESGNSKHCITLRE